MNCNALRMALIDAYESCARTAEVLGHYDVASAIRKCSGEIMVKEESPGILIVRALAVACPDVTEDGLIFCAVCEGSHADDFDKAHMPDCAWLRAVRYVEAMRAGEGR